MQISVVGAGYVGLTTAACLAEIGHQVLCADNDLNKLEKLNSGRLPFFEPHLDLLVQRNVASGRLRFVSPAEAIEKGSAIFICVGTPPLENGEADLSAIESVARTIASTAHGYRLWLRKGTGLCKQQNASGSISRFTIAMASDLMLSSIPKFSVEA